jgi:hypothetical protein
MNRQAQEKPQMPMLQVNVDSSTLAVTSVLSGAITFVFCIIAMEAKPIVAAGIALAVGTLLYVTGIIPLGLLLIVGVGMAVGIAKKLMSSSNSEPKAYESPTVQHQDTLRSAEVHRPTSDAPRTLTAEYVLAPHKSVKDALTLLQEEVNKGTQVPVLLGRVFPSMSQAHAHQINTFYVTLRAQGNSKVGALTHALDEFVKALGSGT